MNKYELTDEQIRYCDEILDFLIKSNSSIRELGLSNKLKKSNNLFNNQVFNETKRYLLERNYIIESTSSKVNRHISINSIGRAIIERGGFKADKERFIKAKKEEKEFKQKQNDLLLNQIRDLKNRIGVIEEEKKLRDTSIERNNQQILHIPEQHKLQNEGLSVKYGSLIMSGLALILSFFAFVNGCN